MQLLDKNSTRVLKFFGPRQYHSEIGVAFRIVWALAVVSIADEKVAIHVWKSSEKESFFFKTTELSLEDLSCFSSIICCICFEKFWNWNQSATGSYCSELSTVKLWRLLHDILATFWYFHLVSVDVHEDELPLGNPLLICECGVLPVEKEGQRLRPVWWGEGISHEVHHVPQKLLPLVTGALLPQLLLSHHSATPSSEGDSRRTQPASVWHCNNNN